MTEEEEHKKERKRKRKRDDFPFLYPLRIATPERAVQSQSHPQACRQLTLPETRVFASVPLPLHFACNLGTWSRVLSSPLDVGCYPARRRSMYMQRLARSTMPYSRLLTQLLHNSQVCAVD